LKRFFGNTQEQRNGSSTNEYRGGADDDDEGKQGKGKRSKPEEELAGLLSGMLTELCKGSIKELSSQGSDSTFGQIDTMSAIYGSIM